MRSFDRIILGAGLYGLYAAVQSAQQGCSVLVLECDEAPFTRATYVNQARVHQGYHYPRSRYTATRSAGYFRRFSEDYGFCINDSFEQIYATSSAMSWSDAQQFQDFCRAADIPCEEVDSDRFFKTGMCDGAFKTQEYTYDAMLLKDHFLEELKGMSGIDVRYDSRTRAIRKDGDRFVIELESREVVETGFLINTTYASVNQVLDLLGLDLFKIKYELCEITLCEPSDELRGYGLTVMDGPFFSIMPFGKTGLHSLTSVSFTPHEASYAALPTFRCQDEVGTYCSPHHLGNCDACPARPTSAFPFMANLARKYLLDRYGFTYKGSLYSMKPILKSSEIDDSRPTVIRVHSEDPTLVSVLSGKINTIYDMDEVLGCD